MTPTTLQALRRLLFFSVEEAARWVAADADHPAGVSPRAWQYWERGGRPVPDAVAERLRGMVAWRGQALATAEAALQTQRRAHGEPAGITVLWYATADDWATLPGRDPAMWRPHQSMLAELVARHGVRPVPFDGPAYAAWRGRRGDSDSLRAAWSAGAPV